MDTNNVIQVEDLLKYVETLESQNNSENSKLSKLTNDLKKEERRKIELEVNIDELKRDMEFYTSQVASARLIFAANRRKMNFDIDSLNGAMLLLDEIKLYWQELVVLLDQDQDQVISKRLNSGKKIHSQFALATECSRRLTGLYENILKPQEFSNEIRVIVNFEASEPSQEIETRHKNIQKNMEMIDELLNILLIDKA